MMTKQPDLSLEPIPHANGQICGAGRELPTTSFYDKNYIDEICEAARAFLLARDAYVGAFVRMNDCALGCAVGPQEEAETIGAILADAVRDHRASRLEFRA